MATKVMPVDRVCNDGNERVEIVWSDGHTSLYSSEWLREHDSNISTIIEKIQTTLPQPIHEWESIRRVSFDDLKSNDAEVLHLLNKVNLDGLCLVNGVGTEDKAVKTIAERIAPISHSIISGEVHSLSTDGKDVPELRLHQDLLYYESPPGLQLIHCTHFDDSVEGGENVFLDGFAAALELKNSSPEDFATLTSTDATFQSVTTTKGCEASPSYDYDVPYAMSTDTISRGSHEPHCFVYQRPHITVNSEGEITGVYWNPRFEGVLRAPPENMSAYYRAYSAFSKLIYDSDWSKVR